MAVVAVEYGIIQRLKDDASITALVGSGTNARISEEFPTQTAALPYITVRRVTTDYRHHVTGTTSLMRGDIQIDVFAETSVKAHALADLIRARLNTFSDTVTIGSDTVVFHHCYIESDNTGFLTPRGGDDARVKRLSHDWVVWVGV